MLRLAIFLGAVLLLFQAGFHRIGEAPAAVPAVKPETRTLTSRIAARPLARRESAVPPLPGEGSPTTPPPFPLAETRAADPARLAPPAGRAVAELHFTVAAPRLSLRAGPSEFYPELGTLARGEALTASRPDHRGWLWVTTADRALSGYVEAALVLPADPPEQVAKMAGGGGVPQGDKNPQD